MALSSRALAQRFSSLSGQLVRSIVTNWGLLSLTITIVIAGSLAFAFAAVPPGTVPYP